MLVCYKTLTNVSKLFGSRDWCCLQSHAPKMAADNSSDAAAASYNAANASDAPATACFNPWGASLPESVQFIVFDFVVPGRRTYDGRGRRVLRDTMNDTSETLCDDRVESSPLWDLKVQPASRAWRAARATGKAFYEDFASVAVARAGESTDGRLRRGD